MLYLFNRRCSEYYNTTEIYNETGHFCCPGWNHNGDQNCSIRKLILNDWCLTCQVYLEIYNIKYM